MPEPVANDPGDTVAQPTPADPPVPLPPPSDRYELRPRPFARGGMGELYDAKDRVLNRRVAVKVIRAEHAGDPGATRRFLDEAQITGQLQHPGVPPVYDLGTLPDGRPFLAMKLIRGRNFSDLLGERPTPAADRARALQIFEQVCHTVAYAHSRNVIHRDLKPANVMIGAFGEVQVMDWGLAKVVAADGGPAADEPPAGEGLSEIELSRGDDDGLTRAGSGFGTPQYMPPEQAQGEWALVGPRADVFALGAMLCEVLTGRPPYTGSLAEVRFKARVGQLADAAARLDACGAEPDLVELARRCLAADPEQRPGDGQAVADRVVAFRAGAEQRVERERLARNADAIDSLLGQCEAALRGDDGVKAAVLLDQAERRALDGGAGFEPRLARARADLAMLQELDRIEELRWAASDNQTAPRATVAAAWAVAFRAFGLCPDEVPPGEGADRIRESAIGERLLDTLDAWLAWAPSACLLALLSCADPDAYRSRVRAAVFGRDAGRLAELADAPDAERQAPRFAVALSEQPGVAAARRERILRAAHERRPNSLPVLMALAAPDPDRPTAERTGWYRAALAAAPANAAAWNNLGITLRQGGDAAGAVAMYRQAIASNPADPKAHYNLGIALLELRDAAGAVGAFRDALRRDGRYARAHVNLAIALEQSGAGDEAVAAYRAALEIDPAMAGAHCNLGVLLGKRGDLPGAVAALRAAVAADPASAAAHYNLGITLQKAGDPAGALAAVEAAVRLSPGDADLYTALGALHDRLKQGAEAAFAYREAARLKPADARAHVNLGLALDRLGREDEAEAAYRRAGELDPKYRGGRVAVLRALTSSAARP